MAYSGRTTSSVTVLPEYFEYNVVYSLMLMSITPPPTPPMARYFRRSRRIRGKSVRWNIENQVFRATLSSSSPTDYFRFVVMALISAFVLLSTAIRR